MKRIDYLWLAAKDAVVARFGSIILDWSTDVWNVQVQMAEAQLTALSCDELNEVLDLYGEM